MNLVEDELGRHAMQIDELRRQVDMLMAAFSQLETRHDGLRYRVTNLEKKLSDLTAERAAIKPKGEST